MSWELWATFAGVISFLAWDGIRTRRELRRQHKEWMKALRDKYIRPAAPKEPR